MVEIHAKSAVAQANALVWTSEQVQRDSAVLPASLLTAEISANMETPIYARIGASLSDQASGETAYAKEVQKQKLQWFRDHKDQVQQVFDDPMVFTYCNLHHLSGTLSPSCSFICFFAKKF